MGRFCFTLWPEPRISFVLANTAIVELLMPDTPAQRSGIGGRFAESCRPSLEP